MIPKFLHFFYHIFYTFNYIYADKHEHTNCVKKIP